MRIDKSYEHKKSVVQIVSLYSDFLVSYQGNSIRTDSPDGLHYVQTASPDVGFLDYQLKVTIQCILHCDVAMARTAVLKVEHSGLRKGKRTCGFGDHVVLIGKRNRKGQFGNFLIYLLVKTLSFEKTQEFIKKNELTGKKVCSSRNSYRPPSSQ